MKKVMGVVISLVSIVIIYGVINLVLVGGQKFWHHDDEVKLEALKTVLKDNESTIKGNKEELTQLENELASLKEAVSNYEANYPDGIPQEYYNEYIQKVDDYNNLLSTYEGTYNVYTGEIDNYNAKVDEANAVAESIGSTWYVIPISRGKH